MATFTRATTRRNAAGMRRLTKPPYLANHCYTHQRGAPLLPCPQQSYHPIFTKVSYAVPTGRPTLLNCTPCLCRTCAEAITQPSTCQTSLGPWHSFRERASNNSSSLELPHGTRGGTKRSRVGHDTLIGTHARCTQVSAADCMRDVVCSKTPKCTYIHVLH